MPELTGGQRRSSEAVTAPLSQEGVQGPSFSILSLWVPALVAQEKVWGCGGQPRWGICRAEDLLGAISTALGLINGVLKG